MDSIICLSAALFGHHAHHCGGRDRLFWLLPGIQEHQHHRQFQESGTTGEITAHPEVLYQAIYQQTCFGKCRVIGNTLPRME